MGTVEIDSVWTAARREGLCDPRSQKRDLGHPRKTGTARQAQLVHLIATLPGIRTVKTEPLSTPTNNPAPM